MPVVHASLTEPARTTRPNAWSLARGGQHRTRARRSGGPSAGRSAVAVTISLVVHVLVVLAALALLPTVEVSRPLIVRVDARSFDRRASAPTDVADVELPDEVEELRPVEAEAFVLREPLPPVDIRPERFTEPAEPTVAEPRPRAEPPVRDLFARVRPEPSPPPAPAPAQAAPQPSRPVAEATPAAEPPSPESSRALTARPGDATPPRYPERARRRGIEGTVLVTVVVDADGIPVQCQVLRSSGSKLLDDAALRAAWSWRFDGGPGSAEIPFVFRLQSR